LIRPLSREGLMAIRALRAAGVPLETISAAVERSQPPGPRPRAPAKSEGSR
jgi:hypothetical protein